MKTNKKLIWAASLLLGAGSAYAASLNFVGQDVGSPALAGSATKNADGTITLVGGGDDIWNASDNFYYYYTWASGQQWDAYFRVRDLAGPDQWSKCELMVRVSDPKVGPRGPDSFLAEMTTQTPTSSSGVTGVNQIGGQGRTASGGSADSFGTQSATPLYVGEGSTTWLRIIRNGSVFTLMAGTNSTTFANVTWYTNAVIDTSNGNVTGSGGTKFTTAFPDVVAVGVAVTAHNNTDTSGATATISDLNATFPGITAPTVIGATSQPANTTNYAGSEATFRFVTTNNATPNVVNWPGYVSYQWYKNGTAVAGATSTAYTFLTGTADDGAQYYAKATVLAPYNTTVSGLTSATGSVKVLPALVYTNGLKNEVFPGASRPEVEAGNTGPASFISLLSSFDDPGGYGNYTTRRVSGFFIPPTTETYTFFVAGDDDTDLFLSTDANPANKKLIAQEVGWSPYRNWLTQGGGGTDASKRSDQWSDTNGTPAWTTTTPLTAGQRYYIEAVLYNGTGGDNLGVTYQTAAQMADPNWATVFTNGSPSLMTAANKNIAVMTGPVSTLSISNQPQSLSVFAGQNATFSVRVSTDSELRPFYQWYRNGQLITNATSSSYKLLTGVPDTGTQFTVVATTPIGGLSVTSAPATLTVKAPVFEKGLVLYERFRGATRQTVENGTAGDPDLVTTFTSFEGPQYGTAVENFAARLSGLFVPKTTGRYVFFTCSDDDNDLFVSTDDNPANKRLVAQESGWSPARAWNSVGGGSTAEQKRSDSFTDANGNTPWSAGIQLTAGQKYYIEAVMHDGTSGDNISATFKLLTDPDPTDGDPTALTGDLIGFYAPAASYVAFQQQPAGGTALSGSTFTMSGKATSDSTISIGNNTNQFVLYQWFRNGTAIAGATSSTYTTPPLGTNDTGVQYTLGARALGIANYSNSAPAVITVQLETTPPTLVSAKRSFSTDTQVIVTFSEVMDSTSANNAANYKINNGAIAVSAAALQSDGKTVLLTTAPIAKGSSNTIAVTGVKDFSLNPIGANTQMAVGFQRGALFIAGDTDPAAPNANDTITINHLKARGYDLQIVGANGDDVSMATDKDIVIISSSVSSGNVTDTYKAAPVPVIEWEQAIQDDMAMTTVGGSADRGTTAGQTALEIVDPTHPLAAGLPAGPVTVTTSPIDFAWGQPDANAHKVAKLVGTTGNFGIYGYDKGALLTDGTAAAERRVLFFMTDNAPSLLNDTGWALFDAAIDWAQGLAVTPVVTTPKLSASVSGKNLVITWAPAVGTLQQNSTLSGGTWTTVPSTGGSATVTIGTTGSMFFRVQAQ